MRELLRIAQESKSQTNRIWAKMLITLVVILVIGYVLVAIFILRLMSA